MYERYLDLIRAYNALLEGTQDMMVSRMICRSMDMLADCILIDDTIDDAQYASLMYEIL